MHLGLAAARTLLELPAHLPPLAFAGVAHCEARAGLGPRDTLIGHALGRRQLRHAALSRIAHGGGAGLQGGSEQLPRSLQASASVSAHAVHLRWPQD